LNAFYPKNDLINTEITSKTSTISQLVRKSAFKAMQTRKLMKFHQTFLYLFFVVDYGIFISNDFRVGATIK
jgi:hypothetical protein